jgi:hypothetical protein
VKAEILVTSDDPYTLVSLKSNQCLSFAPQQLLKSYGESADWSALHTAVSVSMPAVHDLVPDRLYPMLHVGVHVAPLARELVQSPAPPFAGAADASQKGAGTITLISMLEDEIELKTVTPETSEL